MGLKDKVRSKKLTIGSWISTGSLPMTEVMCNSGFDWLVLDQEHTALDLDKIQSNLMLIQGKGLGGLVRIGSNDPLIIKKVLDIGADGLIIPMINTATDVKLAISHLYYPPKGNRGVGLYRAQKYGHGFHKYVRSYQEKLLFIIQIEHIKAVDNIEEILSFNEIDGVMVGPYDLSASMGLPGQYNCDEVKQAIGTIEKAAKKFNKTLGFHVVDTDAASILQRIKQGFSFLAFGIDFLFLADKATHEMKRIKKNLLN